ncbi:hypothetical protein [Adlercreutzia muris]|uniref:Uncharacterized protein n=1 Tax=Adlercreutzia muris TaxID=1796610 RepID=A0A7C8BWF8_9ACTN|nr:hypothetical protein [Adlercreutzia muris]KAB1647964.1 hypothetical protein F8D48_06640 [Adlercreutzia muris]MCR2027746.1 hypothetical protein [Adlercreutzia muris]
MEQSSITIDADEIAAVCLAEGRVPIVKDKEFSARRFMLKQMAFFVAKTFMEGSRATFLRKWLALKMARLVVEARA